ncbi:probable carboxylesterase 18 [Salvia hispanica]|uniref:probable carboxylesterase 18 n=1 Tax=Salvia hispanica TaxID=49212 RepID=UPI0020098302|nr:probable carboxylesterase 18 [Salvia hispanica]
MDKSAVHRPQLPLKTRISLFFLSAVTDATMRPDGTVNRRLFSTLTYILKVPPSSSKPRHGVATSDVPVDPSRGLWFRLFVPRDSDIQKLPVLVFFHGGGFVYLSPDFKAYDDVCRRFARAIPAVVVSVNYRLAPEHPYPAQYDDGYDVLRFLEAEGSRILPEKADLSRCFVAGDSAGGNLAHHVALRVAQHAEPPGELRVLGVIAIQPFFGGEQVRKSEIELEGVDVIVNPARTQFMWKAFMPRADRDHEVINVCGPNAVDISNISFPATMVVVAGFDSLKDWQMSYYNWLIESGKEAYLVDYPNMFHAFYIFPELPESTLLVSELKSFIHKQSKV